MSDFSVRIDDHSAELIKKLGEHAWIAFERIGVQAEGHAKKILTDSTQAGVDLTSVGEKNNSRVDTGRLRNSISHTVTSAAGNDPAVYIGTNVEYAPYHEFGTGIFAEKGGRQSPWIYKDRHGVTHKTRGLYPLHFLRNAVELYMDEYKQIIQDTFDRFNK